MLQPLSVSDVLGFAEFSRGSPELLTEAASLQREIRWAHVVAGVASVKPLDGGELVLTTGAGWPEEDRGLAELAASLVEANPAAICIELGSPLRAAPESLVTACSDAGIPLIVLHKPVRFVQITQRVHQHILDVQHEALEAKAAVHTMLTELGLNRSPVDYVIEQLALTLAAPVILEDSARRVVAWSGAGATATEVLAEWAERGGKAVSLPAGSVRVPVEAQGSRWGVLSALPGPEHPAGRQTVLELGSLALALGRLAHAGEDQWLQLSSKRLFGVLLGGRFRSDVDLGTQLAAAGLPIDGRVLFGATLEGVGNFGGHESLERAVLETALRRAVAPEGRVLLTANSGSGDATHNFDAELELGLGLSPDPEYSGTHAARVPLLAVISLPAEDARVSQSGPRPPLAQRLAHEIDMLLPSSTPADWRAHLSLGVPATGARSLISSLEQVRAAGRLAPVSRIARVTTQFAETQPLAYLVRGLAATPALQEFSGNLLGPLLEQDRTPGPGRSGDLARVLQAYLEQPTNRSLAAQRSRLSRSVFYQRLSLIEDLLGVDLSDGQTIAALTVALLAQQENG